MSEISRPASDLYNRPGRRRSQIEIRFHEVVRESGAKQRTHLRRGPIVPLPSLAHAVAAAVIVSALIVQRGLHPFVETDRTLAPDALTETFFEVQFFSDSVFSRSLVV